MLTRNHKILGSITLFLTALFALHLTLLSRVQQTFTNLVDQNPGITLNFADKHIFTNTIDAEVIMMERPVSIKISPSYFNQKVYFSAQISQAHVLPYFTMLGIITTDQPYYTLSGNFNPLNQVLTIGTDALKLPAPTFSIGFSKAEIALQMDDDFNPSKLVGLDVHDFESPANLNFERLQYDSTKSTNKTITVTSLGKEIYIDEKLTGQLLSTAFGDNGSKIHLSPINYDLSLSMDQKLAELVSTTDHQISAPLKGKLHLLLSSATHNSELNGALSIAPDGDHFKIDVSATNDTVVTDQEKHDENIDIFYAKQPFDPIKGVSKSRVNLSLDSIMLQDGNLKNIHIKVTEVIDYLEAPKQENNYEIKAKGTPIMFTDKTIRQVRLNDEVIGEETPDNYEAFLMISVDSSSNNILKMLAPELPDDMPENQRNSVVIMILNPTTA